MSEVRLRQSLDLINEQLIRLPGFSVFEEAEINRYLADPEIFSLNFRKEAGQGYLYGLALARLRQSFFNQLAVDQRVASGSETFRAHGVWDWVFDCVGDVGQLADVSDIGMGHSVYRLVFSGGQEWVLKRGDSELPVFFSELLHRLEWPFLRKFGTENESGSWVLSEYKGADELSERLHQKKGLSGELCRQLARHACLGDCLGRGDRHFENYVCVDEVLYAVDIAYLFYPENETWVDLYVMGGQSESCVGFVFPELRAVFWQAYQDCFLELQSKFDVIEGGIRHFFDKTKGDDYVIYVQTRLNEANYVQKRREACEKALGVYARRWSYKKALEAHCDGGGDDLDPLLWMYYLSNKDRLTAFFLLDYFHRGSLITDNNAIFKR